MDFLARFFRKGVYFPGKWGNGQSYETKVCPIIDNLVDPDHDGLLGSKNY